MLNRYLLWFSRYHYSVCKWMYGITGSPYWRRARNEAALEVDYWEFQTQLGEINE